MSVEHRTVDTLILGAGLAGLSAAFHLGDCAEIYESESYVGGKARTEYHQGFTFDVTGHWLHLRDEAIRQWILELLGEDHFLKITRKSRVWSHGVYTQYPYQANTYGLPPNVIKSCVWGQSKQTGIVMPSMLHKNLKAFPIGFVSTLVRASPNIS